MRDNSTIGVVSDDKITPQPYSSFQHLDQPWLTIELHVSNITQNGLTNLKTASESQFQHKFHKSLVSSGSQVGWITIVL